MQGLRFLLLGLAAAGLLHTAAIARPAAAPAPCAGCVYHFAQLIMPSDRFSRDMSELFDEQLSFDKFAAYLDEQRIFYSLRDVCMGIDEFPPNVRKVLATFGPGDNLIGKAGGSLLILKIQRLHASRPACLADLPPPPRRDTGAKRHDPRAPNTRAAAR